MPKRSYEEDYYDYEDDSDIRRKNRHFKKDREEDKKKRWERESNYDRDHDYDERR